MMRGLSFPAYRVNGIGFVEYRAWYINQPGMMEVVGTDTPVQISCEDFWLTYSSRQEWGVHAPEGTYNNKGRIWMGRSEGMFSNIKNAMGFPTAAKAAIALAKHIEENEHEDRHNATLMVAPLTPCIEHEQCAFRQRMWDWEITNEQIDLCLEDYDPRDGDKSKSCMSNHVGKLWHLAWEVMYGIRPEPTKDDPIQRRLT